MKPVVSNADSLIKIQYPVSITQKLINRLQGEVTICAGEFQQGIRANYEPYVINDDYFIVSGGKENVTYTTISWSMFGGNTAICRKDILSQETLVAINKNLKKGRVSFCTVYDALVLWNLFRKKPIDEACWIGSSQFKTSKFDDGIFRLENNDEDITCLLLGDMYGNVTFSSRCRIILRYQAL